MNCPPCSGQCRQGDCPRDPPPWLWHDAVIACIAVAVIGAMVIGWL